MKLGPIASLMAVVLLWAGIRTLQLWSAAPERAAARTIAWAAPIAAGQTPAPTARSPSAKSAPTPAAPASAVLRPPVAPAPAQPPGPDWTLEPRTADVVPPTAPPPRQPPPAVMTSSPGRVAVAAWALFRPGIGDPLAPGGQLAGSQAGARLTRAIAPRLALAARISGPLRARRGKEAALGLDLRAGAVTIALERRIGLDRGGRDAFAATAFGGVDGVALPAGFRLDGYAQAGIVGARRRDAFVDGQLRADRPLAGPLAFGAGLWGGAQPGAARLDIGPQLVLRGGRFRIGAEWRQRVAGRARPGSGPVVTLGADF